MTQTELAERMEIPFQRVNSLVNGRRGVTPDTAAAGRQGDNVGFSRNGTTMVALMATLVALPSEALGQDAQVPEEGDRVRIRSPMFEGEATFLGTEEDENLVVLSVTNGPGEPFTISISDLEALEVGVPRSPLRGMGRGVLRGLGWGMLGGVAVSLFGCRASEDGSHVSGGICLAFYSAGLGAIGGVVGGVVGTLAPGTRWVPTAVTRQAGGKYSLALSMRF